MTGSTVCIEGSDASAGATVAIGVGSATALAVGTSIGSLALEIPDMNLSKNFVLRAVAFFITRSGVGCADFACAVNIGAKAFDEIAAFFFGSNANGGSSSGSASLGSTSPSGTVKEGVGGGG